MKEKYVVRLVRPVFQTTYLEVEARDENEARCLAFASSGQIPDDDWHGRYNPEDYRVDAHCVKTRETPDEHPFSLIDFPQYCLLSSVQTPFAGDMQPWMNYLPSLRVACLFERWVTRMSEDRGFCYEGAMEQMEELLRSWKGTDQKVVPLMPPEEHRYRIDLVEAALALTRIMNERD